jgi:nitrite reductase/ring-hydroxylating ferredoxin subunit
MSWKSTGVAVATLADGVSREVTVGGSSILLVAWKGQVHALTGICPHLGGILADGLIEEGHVTCPEHNAQFEIATGKVLVDPFGMEPPQGGVDPLQSYATRVEAGMVEVDLG